MTGSIPFTLESWSKAFLALPIGWPSRPRDWTGTGTRKFCNWLNAEPRWRWRLRHCEEGYETSLFWGSLMIALFLRCVGSIGFRSLLLGMFTAALVFAIAFFLSTPRSFSLSKLDVLNPAHAASALIGNGRFAGKTAKSVRTWNILRFASFVSALAKKSAPSLPSSRSSKGSRSGRVRSRATHWFNWTGSFVRGRSCLCAECRLQRSTSLNVRLRV